MVVATPYLVTAPVAEPVTRAEAKAQLTLEAETDNAFVDGLIIAARKWVEEYLWAGLVSQTWELVADGFPVECLDTRKQGIELPKGKLISVTSVKYIDGDGVEQTLVQNTDYVVDTVNTPGRVRLAYGKSWPGTRTQWDAVRVRYVTGWAMAGAPSAWTGPEPIKQALLLLVSQMYEFRTPEVTGTIVNAVGFSLEALLRPYRLVRF